MPRRPTRSDQNPATRVIQQQSARLDILEQPDAGQTGRRLKELEQLLADLPDISAGISTGNVDASGDVYAGGTVTVGGSLVAPSVYTDTLTGSWRNAFTQANGKLGYVPSSARFKQDIESAPALTAEQLNLLRVVTFRYIAAVDELGDLATVEHGLIAEEVHEAGFSWLVDYDAEGLPFGIKYERLAVALLLVVQDHERRLHAAGI